MDAPLSLMVIDDDPDVLKAARMALGSSAATVETATAPQALETALKDGGLDALLLDMNFALGERSGREGLDWLGRVQAEDADLQVVLMTTYGGVALAVEALKRGAADFVLKPWKNDALVGAMKTAAAETRRRRAAGAQSLDDLERAAIERALSQHQGNISQAAQALGLTRPALYRRMARHGL